jgi:hypothetical protein
VLLLQWRLSWSNSFLLRLLIHTCHLLLHVEHAVACNGARVSTWWLQQTILTELGGRHAHAVSFCCHFDSNTLYAKLFEIKPVDAKRSFYRESLLTLGFPPFSTAGFAGDDAPRSVFPSLIGRARQPGIMVSAMLVCKEEWSAQT